MDLFIGTSIQTSGMTRYMRSGYYKQGFWFCVLINRKKYGATLNIPFWIPHRFNKYQFRFFKRIRL